MHPIKEDFFYACNDVTKVSNISTATQHTKNIGIDIMFTYLCTPHGKRYTCGDIDFAHLWLLRVKEP